MSPSPTGMSNSIGDSQVQPVHLSDSTAFTHPSTMLSTDGANKNQLAISDYLSNAFSGLDFHGLNMENPLESIIPYMASQNSPSAMVAADPSGQGHTGMYDSMKMENPANAGNASLYANLYQANRSFPGASDANFAFNPLSGNQFSQMNCNYPAMVPPSKPAQYGTAGTDFESLQQKISQKKQTLDILQGVLPDPLANQEKRYMTITERIQVPSSDHVAEIVGKNGQRIKQLREQLKVWVKTPSRDEPPIFEVTGLPEKLAEAKRIILQMSEHFTKVQQERLHRVEPNRVEDRLYVEQDKVGLIVGASGQTIRWVQQLSDTHIATPRKQESIPGLPPPQTYFTICGSPDKVKFAKQLICEYVTLRCQGLWLDPDLEPSAEASKLVRDFHQRRQNEDTQRKPATTAATPTAAPPAAATTANGANGTCVRSVVGNGVVDAKQMFSMPPPPPPPQSCVQAAAAAASSAAASGGDSAASVRQLISSMEDMWSRGGSGGGNGAAPWNTMLYGGGGGGGVGGGSLGDRRYSAADMQQSSSGGPGASNGLLDSASLPAQQQQQQQFHQGLQQQHHLAAMKKSHSDEQVSPQLVGPGWM